MIRLFIEEPLVPGALLRLNEKQAHYLLHVMRAQTGGEVLLFNGRDGEWRGALKLSKNHAEVELKAQTRLQDTAADLWLLFAPIKRGHGDLIVEKAAELGVSKLQPVITQRTIVSRVPTDRFRAIAVEAAEQCERLSVPVVEESEDLRKTLEKWDKNRRLLLCAEAGEARPAAQVLQALQPGPLALLTGPEGGFTEEEFSLLRAHPSVTPMRLGPRILRADTAAIAGLTLVQALAGDWTQTK